MTEQASTAPAQAQQAWHALAPEAVLEALSVDAAAGLATAEVDRRRATYGANKFAEAPKEPRWRAFLRQYRDPMQLVLLVAGVACLFLPGQIPTGIVLILLTVFNALMGVNQEGKAEASVAALQKMMVVQAKVRRGGEVAQVPMEDLVPGDIVNIEAGDLVPADGRVIRAATLEIDESALTGESAPVPKQVEAVGEGAAPWRPRRHGVHEHPGDAWCGDASSSRPRAWRPRSATSPQMLSGQVAEETPLTKQLNSLTNQILVIAGVALAISVGLGL